jgi:hypothetical protein
MLKLLVNKTPIISAAVLLVAVIIVATPGRAAAISTSLYFAKGSATSGTDLYVEVRENSSTQPVNAVEADFTYPTSQLTYVGTNNTGTGFEVTASETGGSGSVSIQLGTVTPKTGDQLVATVHFTVAAAGVTNLNFQNSSLLLNAGINMLSQKNNAKFFGIAGPMVPVYRMFNTINNDRLLTMDSNEYNYWLARPTSGWRDEGVAFYLLTSSATNASPIFRFWNSINNDRLLTMDANERAYWDAHPTSGWHDEGVAFYAMPSSSAGLTPVYRMFNTINKDRLLTMDANEYSFWLAHPTSGWRDEGVSFYASP